MEKLTFKVNEYEGPLDLILALLSKHQIGIYDINISDLLEQYMAYITPQAAEEKLLEYPELFAAPIVRNGKQATVGYCPEIWQTWE